MAGEKILLADDDPQIRDNLAEFLREQGYGVTAVADGREALAATQAEGFHLALLDLVLPGLSGMELLSHIKDKHPDTEVILFTGHGRIDSAIQAMRLGAYDYLLKAGLRLEELQAVVARALERRRLALSNRELMSNLRKAQKDISKHRSAGLTKVRRIGEALAVPLTWEQLFHGLLNLIWETIPLKVLGMEFQGAGKGLTLESYRRRPGVKAKDLDNFRDWLKTHLRHLPRGGHILGAKEVAAAAGPFTAILAETAQAGKVLALVAAARDIAFTPEEVELFHILIIQGEAALKNLALFEEVKTLAIRDGLTGLYNYRHFWELLLHEVEKSKRYQQPLSLLFMDLDNFKVINDTLGHTQGDVVLKTLATYLEKAVRQADVVCRYGGEEFVVLLPQTPMGQAMTLAERLRRRIGDLAIPLPGKDVKVTVCIGVAGLTAEMDAEALVEDADAAMYRAKQAGKNRVCGPEKLAGGKEGQGPDKSPT